MTARPFRGSLGHPCPSWATLSVVALVATRRPITRRSPSTSSGCCPSQVTCWKSTQTGIRVVGTLTRAPLRGKLLEVSESGLLMTSKSP
jgi:hypothetical protein